MAKNNGGGETYPKTFRSDDKGGPGCMGTGGVTRNPLNKAPSSAAKAEAEGKRGGR